MPATVDSDQLFRDSRAEISKVPTELTGILWNIGYKFVHDVAKIVHEVSQDVEDQWKGFVQSSWTKHWIPELRYIKEWSLIDIFTLIVILLLTCSWYTIRNARRRQEQVGFDVSANETTDGKEPVASKWHIDLPTYLEEKSFLPPNISNLLGFSTGTSWERRLQTMAMFSCSLAFVMPGTLASWMMVLHFGGLLPLHVFILEDHDHDNDGFRNEEIPAWYKLKAAILAALVWHYMIYVYFWDRSPTNGSRRPWFRNTTWWNHACDFLPVILVKTADLPPTTTTRIRDSVVEFPQKYVMGYHPHGIIAVGAFCAFATDGVRTLDLSKHEENITKNVDGENEADDQEDCDSENEENLPPNQRLLKPFSLSLLDDNGHNRGESQDGQRGFSSLFPKLDRRIVTLPVNFSTPILREFFLAMGAINSQKETFRHYLDLDNCISGQRTINLLEGRAMIVVVGGAAESMFAHEGGIELVLKNRRGFVREAIMADANLVPVLGFGETNLYTLYDNIDDKGYKGKKCSIMKSSLSTVSKILSGFQNFARTTFGVAVPLFKGRSIFFKSLGVMPRRTPVVVVVGKPIPPPSREQLGRHNTSYKGFEPQIDRSTNKPLNNHGKILVEWHAKYVQALEELYNEYKDAEWNVPGTNRRQSMTIVR